MKLSVLLFLIMAQSPQPSEVCVEFRSRSETHWSAGVFTVSELPPTVEDPSMRFVWPSRSLHVFRDGEWSEVEKSDYVWARKSCSEPPWYVPVSQRLRAQRWAEKLKSQPKN